MILSKIWKKGEVMRVSKPPEERKREMIDTAMKLFARKGYEATTMTDIAKEMNVVSGLCYRYFKSKEELYYTALELYASECAAPIIQVLDAEYDSIEEYMKQLAIRFRQTDGRERYHDFFHGIGNELFHKQLEYQMLKVTQSHMIDMLERLKENRVIRVDNCKSMGLFILHGQMPIINDDSLSTEDKIRIVTDLVNKLIY